MFIKKIAGLAMVLSISGIVVSVSAGVDQPYEVGTWGDFAKGAVSFTFDDNTSNQLTVAQPMFDEFGFHMTMFIVCDWVGDKLADYKAPFEKGHEIASHSVSHPSGTMPANQLGPSQQKIKEAIPGEMCATIAYPNCNSPGDNEVKKYYIAGRICNGAANGKTPSNFMQISSTMCGSTGANTTQALNGVADQAASQGGWGVYLMHGMDPVASGESNYSQTSPQALKGCLEYLDKNRNKVWVETFGNVARYIKERDKASVKEKESSGDKIVVEVTDDLPDSIFNFPLSIRRPLPDGWTTAYVSQNDKEIEDSIVTDGSNKFLVFKPVPDGGDVVISKEPPVEIRKRRTGLNNGFLAPVELQRNTLFIDANHFNNANLQVSLFNINGKLISNHEITGGNSCVSLQAGRLTTSALVARVSGGGRVWSGIIVNK